MNSVLVGLAAFAYVACVLVICRALSINELWRDE